MGGCKTLAQEGELRAVEGDDADFVGGHTETEETECELGDELDFECVCDARS